MIVIDPLEDYGWKKGPSCHCMSDLDDREAALQELIEFGKKLKLRRSWIHYSIDGNHFDLTKGKRWQAIRHGAKQITHDQRIALTNRIRDLRPANPGADTDGNKL